MSKLTPKQAAFIDAYMVTQNGAEAVRQAGYKTGNPNVLAAQLLKTPIVMKAISERQEETRKNNGIALDEIVGNIRDAIRIAKEKEDPMGMIRGSAELCKIAGLYPVEKKEITGNAAVFNLVITDT